MYIRKKKNKSGTVSIQVIDKSSGKYQLIKTIGCAVDAGEEKDLMEQGERFISSLTKQSKIDFTFPEDEIFLSQVRQGVKNIFVAGPELILGKIFDQVGYGKIPHELFRHLVITRLVYPGSKLKTVDYLFRYKGAYTNKDRIYRYMDKFNLHHKETAIDLTYAHTKKILNERITVAFYDLTTLYFEASDEDDLRKTGFSKDGKAQNPQILLALLVSQDGHPLAYEIFQGNKFEGHTLIPVVETFKKKYSLPSLIIVADAGLLSSENINELLRLNYPFILGARMKNENDSIKQKILSEKFSEGKIISIDKQKELRLLVHYSQKRAKKDAHLRQQGLEQLEKKLRAGKLTKESINNRGYNKYLKIKNEVVVEIDYEAFKADNRWNGLKGYVTNSALGENEIVTHYKHLWTIEKAFRISKTDLQVRPIYHRLERRIKTHLCISFCSYKIYKELERNIQEKKLPLSVEQTINELKTIYQAQITLPKSKKKIFVLLPLNSKQEMILRAFEIEF